MGNQIRDTFAKQWIVMQGWLVVSNTAATGSQIAASPLHVAEGIVGNKINHTEGVD